MRSWLALCLVWLTASSGASAAARQAPAPFAVMPPLESLRTGPTEPLVPVTLVLAGDLAAGAPRRILQLVPSGLRWPAWRVRSAIDVPAAQARVVLGGMPGEQTLLAVLGARTGYRLDGPFRWPGRVDARIIDARGRRTLLGSLPAAGVTPPFAWVSGARLSEGGAWPACGILGADRWECVGVPWDESGVLVLSSGPPVRFAVAAVPEPEPGSVAPVSIQVPIGVAAWCRLLRVVPAAASWARPRGLTLEPRRRRGRQIGRLRYEPDDRVTVNSLAPGAFWVCGADDPGDAVLHIEGGGVATTDVAYDGWQYGPPEISHELMLDPPVRVSGRVEDARGDPAADTLVVISRVVPRESADASSPDVSLEYAAEVSAGPDGAFEVAGLREGRYEFAGLHPTRGRVTKIVELDEHPIVLRLVPSRRVRGRVLRDRDPVAGVFVGLAPDLTAYMSGVDPVKLASFSALTDDTGRFDVAVPSAGAGVVLIGAADIGIVRVPLGPVDQLPPVTDIGDVELPSPIRLLVELDGPAGCDLAAAGPFGSSAMTVVRGEPGAGGYLFRLPEAGRWVLTLSCGSREVGLVPPIVDVPAGEHDAYARVAARIGG